MGFFKKLWNFVSGKGFAEEENIQQDIEKDNRIEQMREAENIKPQIKETRIEEKKEDIKITKEERQESREVENAKKSYNGKGKISTVQNRLNSGNISSISFQPTSDMGVLRNTYEKLLSNSVISTVDNSGRIDEALIDVIIENRNKLQHRFSAEIMIITNNGEGHLSIDGILAENLYFISEFVQIGQTYTSQELKTAMENALSYFEKQYGAIGGSISPPFSKKSTIQDIQVKMTFA